MAIKVDKQKHKLPTRGRKYSKLGQAILTLKVNESLTVPCKDFDEANSLRQVFNRLKQAGKIHAYRSDWLKAKNRMRVWRLEA